MLLSKNPTPAGVKEIISASAHKAAKWLKTIDGKDIWYWPAEQEQHANVAKHVGITEYRMNWSPKNGRHEVCKFDFLEGL